MDELDKTLARMRTPAVGQREHCVAGTRVLVMRHSRGYEHNWISGTIAKVIGSVAIVTTDAGTTLECKSRRDYHPVDTGADG